MEHSVSVSLTARIARLASHPTDHRDFPPDVVLRAKHSLVDWFACALAGSVHEDSRRLRAHLESSNTQGSCTVLGGQQGTPPSAAALMNGFSGHVLDYDDVNLQANVHATAAVLPATWALAEARKISGSRLLDAFIAGIDATCLLGRLGGARHYNAGWHASSVLGALGSGVACSAILGCDAPTASAMVNLALAQASGVQAVFGTPAKPFQVARGAEAGVHAAMLAEAGFAGHTDVLDRPRSLPELFSFEAPPGEGTVEAEFSLRNTLLKFHASCFGTHAPLEAVRELQQRGLTADNFDSLEIALAPHTANVCSIDVPVSASELKFSVAHLCAMRLAGIETGGLEAYSDAAAADSGLRAMARKIKVLTMEGLQTAETDVHAALSDGRKLSCHVDMGVAEPDLHKQAARVETKFNALASPVVGALQAECLLKALLNIEEASDVRDVLSALR